MPKDAFCSYCGKAFVEGQPWPRVCPRCRQTSYLNPIPVVVLLQPVDNGLLCVRRAIEPGAGKLALPGGFVDVKETWQQAASRELFEETGVTVEEHEIEDFRVRSSPASDGVLLIFGLGPRLTADSLPTFRPTDETNERVIVRAPVELAFPLHTDAVREYFLKRRKT